MFAEAMNKLASGFLVFCLYHHPAANAQQDPGLLRMERVQRGEAVCVLVRDDGSYRLEKLFQAKTEMYSGSLGSIGVGQLRTMLANEQLRKLAQENIHSPLISDTIDTLQLDIWRDRGWQDLRFFAPESRKPFQESLDPLLRWFQQVQKHPPTAVRVEGPPMRCQPMRVTELVTTAESPEAARAAAGGESSVQYIFRARSIHSYQAHIDSTCIIVYGDGRYHWEHSGQSYGADRKDKLVDGHLEPEAIQKLKAVLDSPDLESSPSIRDVGNPRPASEGTFTEVHILRKGGVQNLIFATSFNPLNNKRAVGGLSNLQYHVADSELLVPLEGWMKLYTDKHPNAVERGTAGSDCAPVSADALAKTNSGSSP
jgi:hypothetical protein